VQISSINEIIQGKLLNFPAVSFIYNVKTDVKKILEGDLFFALNEEDIPAAIEQGAFAIVIEKNTAILDNEIAWIKVDSLSVAIVKYLRYKLSQVELQAYHCDDISYELLKIFSNQLQQIPKIWLFSTNTHALLSHINDLKSGDTLICNNQELLISLYPNYQNFNQDTTFKIKNLIEHSLFETSFSYKDYFFSRIKLSSLYIQPFLEVSNFIGSSLDVNKLKKVNYFKPIFIDKFFNACEYGKSDKFILIQEKENLAQKELKYIHEKYKYAKTIVFSKEPLLFEGFDSIIVEDLENIFQILQDSSFNAVYIIGFKKQKVEQLFENNNSTTSLL